MTFCSMLLALSLYPMTGVSDWPSFVLLYVGPDQILPFTSFLGAILGILLMFWNRAIGVARRLWMIIARK
jgi:hypothetical protein